MVALYLGLLGLLAFLIGLCILGVQLKRQPSKENAEKFSRIMHFLFFAGLGVPFVVAFGIIPAHLFFLKFFEELELELRFDDSYQQYKRQAPFLFPRMPVHAKPKTTQL